MTASSEPTGGDTPPPPSMERIFIGGLGATVTSEDLKTTFGSVGRVESVEIVRTKGRSFAYLDFLPSSEKSLSKLFSMYNGCMWKGGRLKLEKAKEHYLLRLKREQSEDAELANATLNDAVDATNDMDSLKKLNKMINPNASEIRLFFPKLRKLRPLPSSGTGKHKYSFQRIEVPSLPSHFCDCEEHSKPLYLARDSKFFTRETNDGGIDEKELNIMESVMNKLLCKEENSKGGTIQLANGRGNTSEPVDVLTVHDNKADDIICETHDGGIDEKELTIMDSVMNKLLEKEEKSKGGTNRLANGRENTSEPVDDLTVDDNEADDITDDDDDNLVMNMVATGFNRKGSLRSFRQEKDADSERALADGLRLSKDRPLHNVSNSQRIKTSQPEKKRKSSNTELTDAKDDIEGKRSLKKARPRDSARETEKVSATYEAKDHTSLLKVSEKNMEPAISRLVQFDEGKAAAEPVDEIEVDDCKSDDMTEEEEDGLVLNLIGGTNGPRQLIERWRGEKVQDIKGPVSDAIQISKSTPLDGILKSRSSKNLSSEKKRKAPQSEVIADKAVSFGSDGKRIPSKARKNGPNQTTGITSMGQISTTDDLSPKQKNTSHEKPIMKSSGKEELDSENENQNQNLSQERSEAAATLDGLNAGLDKQPKKGALWAQKSSWTDLVGGTNASFSISKLLPSKKFEEQEPLEQPKNFFAAKVNEPRVSVAKSNVSSPDDGSKASSVVVKGKSKISPVKYTIGETCTFMRSDSSMKEWKSTKAALNESLKKKSNEKK